MKGHKHRESVAIILIHLVHTVTLQRGISACTFRVCTPAKMRNVVGQDSKNVLPSLVSSLF